MKIKCAFGIVSALLFLLWLIWVDPNNFMQDENEGDRQLRIELLRMTKKQSSQPSVMAILSWVIIRGG